MMKRTSDMKLCAVVFAMAMLVASCGTKKAVSDSGASKAVVSNAADNKNGKSASTDDGKSLSLEQVNYLRKVYDNAVYANNIVSKIKFSINTGSNDVSVGGSLHMKKDVVIRIQITPFGIMEAGRLEFTKDYVLLVDRIHKEYVKASYSDVDFLQRNGLDFYTLQAIFWNQLFVPGTQKMTDSSLKNFTAKLDGAATTDVSLSRGKMKYIWNTDSKTGYINSVNAQYVGTDKTKASVNCKYSAFKAMGTKHFPTDIYLTMDTKAVKNADKMSLRLQLNTLSNESDWEEKTTVSSKYKEVSVQDILGKLGSM